MGRTSAQELLGKHPAALAPALQPNGERSEVLGRKYIEECMHRGSARFEWVASAPDGREIPLEVALTRIQWSGRQIIQAFITDITERKRAQAALAESEARFSAAFQATPIFIAISQASDGRFVLVNDAFVKWSGYTREEMLGRNALELGMWEHLAEREAFWEDLRRSGALRDRGMPLLQPRRQTLHHARLGGADHDQSRPAHAGHVPRHHRAQAGPSGAGRKRGPLQRRFPRQPGVPRHPPIERRQICSRQ
jgi:PAS domain S-box-containing protein